MKRGILTLIIKEVLIINLKSNLIQMVLTKMRRFYIIIILNFSLLKQSMIKNELRLTFKKRQRNPFIQKFKTQVRESSSIDAIRLTPVKSYYNSQSPLKDKTVLRKINVTTALKDKQKEQKRQKALKTIKIKLNYISPTISQGQTPTKKQSCSKSDISNFNKHQGSLIELLEQSSRDIARKTVEKQYKRERKSENSEERQIKIAEEMIEATHFLLSHSNKLKKYHIFQDQAQILHKVLSNLASKLEKVCKQQQNSKKISIQNVTIHKQTKPFLKKKMLFQPNNAISQNLIESQGHSSTISYHQDNLKVPKSKDAAQSITSFKIQNQSSHQNQHFFIYDEKISHKGGSDRDFSIKSCNQIPSAHKINQFSNKNIKIASKYKQKNPIKLRKGSQQITKLQNCKKKPRKYSEQQKRLESLPQYTFNQENDEARIYSTNSSVENERKRNVLNEIIGLLNKKYSRKISRQQ